MNQALVMVVLVLFVATYVFSQPTKRDWICARCGHPRPANYDTCGRVVGEKWHRLEPGTKAYREAKGPTVWSENVYCKGERP